jgi:hypothetical protein
VFVKIGPDFIGLLSYSGNEDGRRRIPDSTSSIEPALDIGPMATWPLSIFEACLPGMTIPPRANALEVLPMAASSVKLATMILFMVQIPMAELGARLQARSQSDFCGRNCAFG